MVEHLRGGGLARPGARGAAAEEAREEAGGRCLLLEQPQRVGDRAVPSKTKCPPSYVNLAEIRCQP